MPEPVPDGMTRAERILSEKLELLYRNATAVVTNFVIAAAASAMLWDVYPHRLLIAWLAAVFVVCAARLFLQRRYLHTPPELRCTHCSAWQFALGAFAAGLLWGGLCLGLPSWGDQYDYILMAITCGGMTAAAVATTSVYYPAFLLYTAGFAIPLALVTMVHPNGDLAGTGAMMVIYLIAISFSARNTNRLIASTVELRVDNKILQASLQATRVERDAARTDKWSTLSQLSHELRTPLNAIMGFSEAMRDELFGSLGHPRYKEYAAHVLTSGYRLLGIADEMLLLSQGECGTLILKESDVDVAALLRALADQRTGAATTAGLSLDAAIAGSLPLLHADKIKLHQMLLHLVNNAIKFTPPGGRVTVTAALRAGGVLIAVRDTGIGMNADQIAQALQPFGRAATPLSDNTAGAGLGLPICRRLAELHGARLTIDSIPGEGTLCTVTFPAARTLAARIEPEIATA